MRDTTTELLAKGYVLYMKNGKIEVVKPPVFGEVVLKYQDGKMVLETVSTQKK
ncbi:hypothetical protein NHG34_05985 [Aerococcaceae bacterium NML190938]|nr:hypothetical protein [Aerococcaceae bacterium NML190938]MCW6675823.1 hypothetical protein [Aerococcaceae bacterium NML171108]